MRPSPRVLALAVLMLAFAGGFWAMRRPAERPAAVAVAVVAPAATPVELVAAAAPSPSASPVRYSIHTETQIANGTLPEMESVIAKTADDYERRARFPRWSQPIADGVDPILRDREVTRAKSLGPEGTNPTLVAYPERTGFEAPNAIVLHAYLVHDNRKVDPKDMQGEIRTQEGGVLAALAFHDDGQNGDAEANDLIYTAVVAPGREHAREFKGAQLVEVHAETKKGDLRVATTGFLYSVPLAHLTGRYRDELVDGNLVVSAEVLVDESGRFHLEATIAAADGTLITWAQSAQVLDPGTGWIPLTFFGLTLREAGRDGPYVLASAALSTTGEMPNQKNDVVLNAYTTQHYAVTAFSDRTFDDPGFLDQAARMRADQPIGGANGLEAARR